MDITEMHNVFRTFGQQMGMQTVRAILPEDIDIYINNKIIETVRKIVSENTTTVYKDKITFQDNAISPINAIKTLYEKITLPIINGNGTRTNPYSVDLVLDDKIMYYTGLVFYYPNNKSFKCRLLIGEELEDTLNDYCNRSSWDAPIADIKHKDTKMIVDIYTDDTTHVPNFLGVRYIAKPNKVVFSEEESKRVDCNLPEHLHHEIVTSAVFDYFKSVGFTVQNNNS